MNLNVNSNVAGLAGGLSRPTAWKRILFYITGDAFVVFGASLLTYTVAKQQQPNIHIGIILPYAAAGLSFQVLIAFIFSSYRLKWSTFSLPDLSLIHI